LYFILNNNQCYIRYQDVVAVLDNSYPALNIDDVLFDEISLLLLMYYEQDIIN
jgi:hypothetical protein